jgi:hypothetical protein
MHRSLVYRRPFAPTTALVLALLAAVLLAGPALAAKPGTPTAKAPRERSADLAAALGADGTFLGASDVAGAVDASAWTLVSDLAAGEPPRFAPAAGEVSSYGTTAIGLWSALGSNGAGDGALDQIPYNGVDALAVSGSDLYVGGGFLDAAGIATADDIAKWNGTTWSALGSNGSGDGAIQGPVQALAVSGSDLYVGGWFANAAGIPGANNVAKWNGRAWSALGDTTAINDAVYALAVSGSNLYVGGIFDDAADIWEADGIAKWNGSAWSALGSNGAGDGALTDAGASGFVAALAVSYGALYVGGSFNNAAGIATADNIAKWNGSAWSALGSNGAGDGAIFPSEYADLIWYGDVAALAVSGSDLYVGGSFLDVAGIPAADYVAKWNGIGWSALGSNGAGDGALAESEDAYGNVARGDVYALAVSGSDLYVGGEFANAAGIPAADYVAKWNGSDWSALGSNGAGDGALDHRTTVGALAVSGSDLYVGGTFVDAAGIATADNIAKWSTIVRQPDGRIRLGTGAYVGNDIYNTSGAGQSRRGSARRGHSITFGISIQNDGTSADRIRVKATGIANKAYTVKYLRGTTNITKAVVAGAYKTRSLAPAATYLITARVTVRSTAAAGSKVTRLVTITSVGNSARKDAVRFIGKRS